MGIISLGIGNQGKVRYVWKKKDSDLYSAKKKVAFDPLPPPQRTSNLASGKIVIFAL